MHRTSFSDMACPVARTLDRVGEWWSILILRDAFFGLTRFDQFQASLGIAPNMLARRLSALVDGGMLERRRYSDKPPRDDYVLTNRGRDFLPVLDAFKAFGERHFPLKPIEAPSGEGAVPTPVQSGGDGEPSEGAAPKRGP